jgi:hypothetical protein
MRRQRLDTGDTSARDFSAGRVLAIHPAVELIGIDESRGMLAAAVGRRSRPTGGPPRGPAA